MLPLVWPKRSDAVQQRGERGIAGGEDDDEKEEGEKDEKVPGGARSASQSAAEFTVHQLAAAHNGTVHWLSTTEQLGQGGVDKCWSRDSGCLAVGQMAKHGRGVIAAHLVLTLAVCWQSFLAKDSGPAMDGTKLHLPSLW
jgi:hypothetical protein